MIEEGGDHWLVFCDEDCALDILLSYRRTLSQWIRNIRDNASTW
jgi:hypothetical protein